MKRRALLTGALSATAFPVIAIERSTGLSESGVKVEEWHRLYRTYHKTFDEVLAEGYEDHDEQRIRSRKELDEYCQKHALRVMDRSIYAGLSDPKDERGKFYSWYRESAWLVPDSLPTQVIEIRYVYVDGLLRQHT